jgi:hypothetical protein
MRGRGGSRLCLCIEVGMMGMAGLDMKPVARKHVDLDAGGTY